MRSPQCATSSSHAFEIDQVTTNKGPQLQGCCFSSDRSPANSPYTPPTAATAPDASDRNITVSSPPHPASLLSHANTTPRASHASHHHHHTPPSTATKSVAPNQPLRPLTAGQRCDLPASLGQEQALIDQSNGRHPTRPTPLTSSTSTRWTRTRLERERRDFFDTRVTGNPEIWALVRTVVQLIRAGQVREAQGVLDAGACTCPTGEVWRGVFDERGEFYKVPEWVVVEPSGLVEEREDGKDSRSGTDDEFDEEDAVVEKVDKGKGRAVEGDEVPGVVVADKGNIVKVKARLSDRGTDVAIKIGSEERVGLLVRRIRDVADIEPHTRLKIAYMGKILHDHETLASQGWREKDVVNALVFQ
ncbi:uncharacterized protein BDZ99DRAFT_480831 [Mytilinidion resinicola]|uniref:Ubiquitin-like domain-containing protein n=1 Tax=Mytilinidion resinicola TaxID=574789 RepID=A0A6A6Y876_9PEZI|nr:uncharacterized protein BDZ99DRAFT_480831 [Mytilinidion resinicola]KAF2804809.1 hypothetical protein BDZ99DRAFT_480831 [Mytilinidion resinicola]